MMDDRRRRHGVFMGDRFGGERCVWEAFSGDG